MTDQAGPLAGLRVLEIASLAPAPFGCMVLADLGADVVRVDRADGSKITPEAIPRIDPLQRGRRALALDLKTEDGRDAVRHLAERADVFVEGFRPGVTERLGIGPDELCQRNPRLIYARMTGWGQTGSMALRAGHDINYIAASGALDPIGRPGDPPTVPLNLVGDFGGGGLLLVTGVLAALFERGRSGLGQVLDVSMVDGSALLTASLHGMIASRTWSPARGTNLLDGGAPFYDTYETADGKYVSVGAIERKFFAELIAGLGIDRDELPDQYDQDRWPELRGRLTVAFKARDRDEWDRVFAGTDACVYPVLSPTEAASGPFGSQFVEIDGHRQPGPAPRFSRTPAVPPVPTTQIASVDDVLASWAARE
jgi:alpha-methylacyl-CoA racemase